MKKLKLDKFEKEIEKSISRYNPISTKERDEIEKIIKRARFKRAMTKVADVEPDECDRF